MAHSKDNPLQKAKPIKTGVAEDRLTAVVGIAVGAGSLEALKQLMTGMGNGMGAAYVIVVKQRDGLHADAVLEALTSIGASPVGVADGTRMQPGGIYVGAAGTVTGFKNGRIVSRHTDQPLGLRGTVDSMLVSMAETHQERCVAVLLTGLDDDGTAGVAATKQNGGLSILQSVDDEGGEVAKGGSGPAGVVDLLLPIERIAGEVGRYIQGLTDDPEGDPAEAQKVSAQIGRVATILRNATGNDFHGYKHNTFLRRIQRRMQVVQVVDIDAYIARLKEDRDEVQHLFQDLLIGVTQFFRDPHEFEFLAKHAIPKMFEGKGVGDHVRVWVMGCATGEEAYSIAILLREQAARMDSPPHIQIFATDLDARALGMARAGRYGHRIAEHVTPERLARWFVHEGDTYAVCKELREMCIFSPHNMIKDAPFSRMDLLSCRNLLIYLNTDLQDRVIPIFHFSLRPDGFLFLGPSENITRHHKLFSPLDRKNRIFQRLETATRVLPDFPLSPRLPGDLARHVQPPVSPRQRALNDRIERRAGTALERYAPAHVIIDDQYEVLSFAGRTGRYLGPAAGTASLNLLNLVHRELRLELRAALKLAAGEGQRVESAPLRFDIDDRPTVIRLVVEPLALQGETPVFAVIFVESQAHDLDGVPSLTADSAEHVSGLESELRLTKDRLQATIEELESTNEELKSSNEEYQSINEELQSANEELETSKEELQSVNEELQTVNGEMAHRVTELARANSDLKNLLESTQIATIFLDNDLRVRSFTPAIADIFHVLETDTGRPIGHLASRLTYPELQADVRKVIKTLAPTEREVISSEDDARYLVRVLPYRSTDNFIAGAVVTFLDVSAAARAETALFESASRFKAIFELSAVGQSQADAQTMTLTAVNPKLAEMLGYETGELIGMSAMDLTHPDDRKPMQDWWDAIKAGLTPELHQDKRMFRKDGSVLWVRLTANVILGANDRALGASAIVQDITDERAAQERQTLLLRELQHRVRNTLAVIRSVARRTGETSDSVEAYAGNLDGRIAAFARTQAAVTRDPSAGLDLATLIRDELSALDQGADQVRLAGPVVVLQAKAAETLGLALHELATNAVKYGALSSAVGALEVRWGIEPDTTEGLGRLTLDWIETTPGVAQSPPARKGFGSELLQEGLKFELEAETSMTFSTEGLRFQLVIPVAGNILSLNGLPVPVGT